MIPQLFQQLIDKRDFQSLYKIIATSKNKLDIAWAEFGVAECWRLGGNNFSPNKSYACNYFEKVLESEHILPAELVALSYAGKADCFRVGDDKFSRDFKLAYSIYMDLTNKKGLSREIHWRLLFGQADCLRTGLIYTPGHLRSAHSIYENLLQEIHVLPDILKIRALFGKAECLIIGDNNLPQQPKKCYEILSELELQSYAPTLTPYIKYYLAECLLMEEGDYKGDTQRSLQLCQELLSSKTLLPAMIPLVQECMSRGLSRKEKERPAMNTSYASTLNKLNNDAAIIDPEKPAAPILSEASTSSSVLKPKLKPRKIYNSDDYAEYSNRSPK
jgi:hypothetical protein